MSCPICNCQESVRLLELHCGKLDNSTLYDPAIVVCCNGCGHVFNQLSEHDMQGVIEYYSKEYSINNLSCSRDDSDMPGSNSASSKKRYTALYKFLSYFLNKDLIVLDVGCATGGFMDFLKNRGIKNINGIDISLEYIREAQKKHGHTVNFGTAEDMPYPYNTFDMIIADQVAEHLYDPNKLFREARRTLKEHGLLCLSVPNAPFYANHNFFDFYWFLMREHIQHFDELHLTMLARKHGFIPVDGCTSVGMMLGDRATLPNLTVLYSKFDSDYNEFEEIIPGCKSFFLKERTQEYIEIEVEKLKARKSIMSGLKKADIPLYVYGMSREFLYLYSNTVLSECNIVALIDDTPFKQNKFTVNGMRICDREILRDASGAVLITATAHTDAISKRLRDIGFLGDIIGI